MATVRCELCTLMRSPGRCAGGRTGLGEVEVEEGEDGVDDAGGDGGVEGGGRPGGSRVSTRLARGSAGGEASATGVEGARFAARSASGGGGDVGGGGGDGGSCGSGGGDGGGGGCSCGGGGGGGGGVELALDHHCTMRFARNTCARRINSACAEARARDRSARVDGSFGAAVAVPVLVGAGLASLTA